MNEYSILGVIGHEPKVIPLGNNSIKVVLKVVTEETWRDKSTGEMRNHSDWHEVEVYGPKATYLQSYAQKGDWVRIKGKAAYHQWKVNGTEQMASKRILEVNNYEHVVKLNPCGSRRPKSEGQKAASPSSNKTASYSPKPQPAQRTVQQPPNVPVQPTQSVPQIVSWKEDRPF